MDPPVPSEEKEPAAGKRDRFLFFDVLRIIFIALIVFGHSQFPFVPGLNAFLFRDGYLPYGIYPLGMNLLAVFGMIFISGAMMEYNHPRVETATEYKVFVFHRFIRLYPAYWMSLLLALLLPPWIFPKGLSGIGIEFTGFFFLLGQGAGYLNNMGWFIGTIFCLYLLFPFLSKIVRRYQLFSLLFFMVLSYLSRFVLLSYDPNSSGDLLFRWFPLTNLFEFCLGIYLVQHTFYPKKINKSPVILFLARLSFYVFLFHNVVIVAFLTDAVTSGQILKLYVNTVSVVTNDFVFIYSLWFVITMAVVLFISWCAMILDAGLHEAILRNKRVRTFLKG